MGREKGRKGEREGGREEGRRDRGKKNKVKVNPLVTLQEESFNLISYDGSRDCHRVLLEKLFSKHC